MSVEFQQGIYEIYDGWYDLNSLYPLGIASFNGQAPLVAYLSPGTPAHKWTITKVSSGRYTLSVNGSYVASGGEIAVPSSQAYPWRIKWEFMSPTVGNVFTIRTPDEMLGWDHEVQAGRRDNIIAGQKRTHYVMAMSRIDVNPFCFAHWIEGRRKEGRSM